MNSLFTLDKTQIERQFERAAVSYDQAASLQRDIIGELIEHTDDRIGSPVNIADMGCGTGLGLAELHLRFPRADITGVDLSQAMLNESARACPSATLLKADIEQLPVSSDSFDLVFSSSSIQWCDLTAALSECARTLKPGGYLALATFGPETHREWKSAWAQTDALKHTLRFPDQAKIAETMLQVGIAPLEQAQQTRVQTFKNTREVLASVKALGATNANAERQRGLMGKQRFNRFLSAFEDVSPKRQLTYEVFYFVGRKASVG